MNYCKSVVSLSFALVVTGLPVNWAYAQNDSRSIDLTVSPIEGVPAGSAGCDTANVRRRYALVATGDTPNFAPTCKANTIPWRNHNDIHAATTFGLPVIATRLETASCDADRDNKAQIHGSVDVGVAAGSHFSGNYQSGTVTIVKPLGDCDEPRRTLSITVHVSQSSSRFSRPSH